MLKKYMSAIAYIWGRHSFWAAGVRVEVTGVENIPKEDNILFVSNHQGIADIPVILSFIPKPIGFIAKKELAIVPLINVWMLAFHCIFIDRGNIKSAHEVIEKGAENIRHGYPMAVFPEGTRSRGEKMGVFKRGSLKLALKSEAIIVPLTINGTYRLLEERGVITPGKVRLIIHPPVDVKKLSGEERKDLAQRLQKIIESGLRAKEEE